MEDFVRFSGLVLTPSEADICLASERRKYLTVLKVVFHSSFARVVSIEPHIRPLDLKELKEYLNPMSNTELSRYAGMFVMNRCGELSMQYRALMAIWTKESNITDKVGEYVRSNTPAKYILDITRLIF